VTVVIVLAVFLIVLRTSRRDEIRRLLILLLPVSLLFGILLFPTQAQNVSYRFQAPISLSLLFALVVATTWMLERFAGPLKRALIVLLASRLGPEDVIAVTEAGRFSYWTRSRVEDLVGLNNREMALKPPGDRFLEEQNPVVVMFHHAGTLDPEKLVLDPSAGPIVPLTPARLAASVRARFRTLLEVGADSYADPAASSQYFYETAAVIATRLLLSSERYDIYALDYVGNDLYYHVFAFRKDWPHTESALAKARATLDFEVYESYLALKRARRR
jgi:hypothetical protein